MIHASHNLPTQQPFASSDARRAVATTPPASTGERRSAPREQATVQVPGERVLDGELQEELLREAGMARRNGATLEGATWRAQHAIHSYESVRSASPAFASTNGLLLDTYA